MLEQFFMPLDRHFDGGFNATGDAFKAAAAKLAESPVVMGVVTNTHLPINYLFRHAIELYLKSMILILTRVIEKSDSPLDPTTVKVQVFKDKPLTSVHSLKTLMDETQRLVTANSAEIARLTPTDWNTPPELLSWIDTIEQHDAGSTFSRYPTSKSNFDNMKSSFQSVELDSLAKKMEKHKPGEKGHFALLMKNDDGEIVEAFTMRDEILPELRTALVEASNLLSNASAALQAELAEGYGWRMKERSEETTSSEEQDEPNVPNCDELLEHLLPRINEVVANAKEILGTDPILICCDGEKMESVHPVVRELFCKHGPTCIIPLSGTLFCLPVSNQQFREGLINHPDYPLDIAVQRTETGTWIMCFEEKGILMAHGKEQEEAE